MKSRIKQTASLLVLLAVFIPIIIMASSSGRISGTVTDKATGGPIVGATVLLVETSYLAFTDTNGKFSFESIKPGIYTLRITHKGHTTLRITEVEVSANKITVLALITEKVNPGTTKTVEITAETINLSRFDRIFEVESSCKTDGDKKENRVLEETQRMSVPHHKIAGESMSSMCNPTVGDNTGSWFSPAHGGTAIVNGEAYDAMFFKHYGVNPFVDTEDDHFSTFAIDVDDASYIMTRSYLEHGNLPPDEAVRVEEFVNHFNYDYDIPDDEPFAVLLEGAPSKFGQNCHLLRIGIKGIKISKENRKPANLVFVIDVSGSMRRENRLGLVKKALRLLVNELEKTDKVGIIVYGNQGEVILEPTSIANKEKILGAIEFLHANGSTNAEEGLRLGYNMADRHFNKNKINRIILCSDGVANVGVTKAEDLLEWIKQYADRGITLSSIGFGMSNYNDILLEKLGNKGNGNYAYVDDIAEARRIFIENLTGTLQIIARDVKIQVDFNPEVVRSYRLLGYENRNVDDDKFRDDKEDGGEVGSGHEVTALYEIKFQKDRTSGNTGTVFIRYKNPEDGEVYEISHKINRRAFKGDSNQCSVQFRLAAVVAEFAEILRDSYWVNNSSLSELLALAREIYSSTSNPEVLELMSLISKANILKDHLAEN